jgi:uncharacterized peroxidase-related enzyme
MDQKVRPSPRLDPLPVDHTPELKESFEGSRKQMGFVPNSRLIMQRKPKMVKGLTAISAAIWDPDGKVPLAFRRLIGHVCSHSAGCQYCMAHTAESAHKAGLDDRKLDAVWEYKTSPLFSPAERAALDVAVAGGCVPNAVTDEMFVELKKYWSEEEIVEIIGVIALFGFLNRWNDTMASPLEAEPTAFAEDHLAKHGWTIGRHAR